MGKLLRLEFRKLLHYKCFYICFGVAVLLALLNSWLFKNILNDPVSPNAFAIAALSNAAFVIYIGICVALVVCDDFGNHTLKNIYGRGYSRTSVFFAKYLVSLLACLVFALAVIILYFLTGEIFGKAEGIQVELLKSMLLQLWIVAGWHGLFFGISMMIGKAGGSIAINIVGPMFVVLIISLVANLLELKFDIRDYWLGDTFNSGLMGEVVDGTFKTSNAILWRIILMPIFYVVTFGGLGFWLNYRREM